MLFAGIDVGSTTVKCVLMDGSQRILFSDYRRHEARQMEIVLDYLRRIENSFGSGFDLFLTGSGGGDIAKSLGVRFIQEVNAVSLAVETIHGDVSSVVELGGQDAKIIIYHEFNGKRRKITSMNDKCAGGTGATIDRIIGKLKIPYSVASAIHYDFRKVHHVAAKCGVFAETDINSLQKSGVPEDELLISLFDAIVMQNLTVLTRGYTLKPKVLLLGGPNTFFPALVESWKFHLQSIWKEKGIEFDEGSVFLPENSQLYAAIGSALFGFHERSPYRGSEGLKVYMRAGREEIKRKTGEVALLKPGEDLEEFRRLYGVKPPSPRRFKEGEVVEAFLGIDGGSTSTKAVLIDGDGNLLASSYTLSSGNPLLDVKRIVSDLRRKVESEGAKLRVLYVGVTGYAKEMLAQALGADVSVVETVAHTVSARRFFDDVDVIVDVGGQDIKVMIMSGGRVKDFKLNTQCSAGNGYFLQSTAEKFGFRVEEFADVAFRAKYAPRFSFGCAVFLEQDIINFQRLGWEPHEIMAGLAKVLPKNVWLYVVKEPNLRKLGKRFLLQGGTQRNLAVVKAQYDFIKERVPDAEVFVHPITGEAGAYGAAFDAMRRWKGERTSFIGIDAIESLDFSVKSDESTRCSYCTNRCLRTFIEVRGDGFTRNYIIAPCERGRAMNVDMVREVSKRLSDVRRKNPNLQDVSASEVFSIQKVRNVFEGRRFGFLSRRGALERRKRLKVGIPRTLNFYSLAPFFTGYLKSLGVEEFILSERTSEKMLKRYLKGGAIDPCFPSKVALAHINSLIEKNPDIILFPKIATLQTFLKDAEGSHACPTVTGTPISVKSVLTKEGDVFRERGIVYVDPVLHFHDPELLEYELFEAFSDLLSLSRSENRKAIEEGFGCLNRFVEEMRRRGKQILRMVEYEERVAILVLGRPYHNDPGINHGITSELQKLGYPILTIESLPVDGEFLSRVFPDRDPFSIRDIWKKAYSENTNRKIWGALYAAGHPNIAVLDLSSFRCGHDAPIYSVIEEIMERSGTPYFTFHEIDENKPSGSIKIRVETIDYFLKDYRRKFLQKKRAAS